MIALVALTTFDIGGGMQVAVTPDPTSLLQDGSLVVIRKNGKDVVQMRTRQLIEAWLPVDSFWGGHAAANQMRYADHPIPDAVARLQGRLFEVVPAPGGCLLRIGIIDTSPSLVRVNQDVVLRWQSSAPDRWPVIDRSMDGSLDTAKTVKLPRFHGTQYLVTTHAVYRLSGQNLRRTRVAELPKPGEGWGWVGTSLAGANLSVELPRRDQKPTQLRVNLSTSKLTEPKG